MADTEVIVRPNGKLYRPRKGIVVVPWDDDTWGRGDACGVVVLGTHNVDLAQKLADKEIRSRWDSDMVGISEGCGWFRDTYRYGDRVWATDPECGRAGVWFRADYPPAPTTLEWIVSEDSDFWPCPMACGGATEDEAGGPCKACWAKAPRGSW